jgi:cytochrome c2
MEAAAAQDKEAFFQAGAQLYSVCTACHQAYNPDILNRFDEAAD